MLNAQDFRQLLTVHRSRLSPRIHWKSIRRSGTAAIHDLNGEELTLDAEVAAWDPHARYLNGAATIVLADDDPLCADDLYQHLSPAENFEATVRANVSRWTEARLYQITASGRVGRPDQRAASRHNRGSPTPFR